MLPRWSKGCDVMDTGSHFDPTLARVVGCAARALPPSRPRARHSHPSPPRLDALRVLTLELCVCLLPLLLRLPTSTRARRGLLVELVPRRECLALGGADSIMHAELECPGRGGRRVHMCNLDTFATDPYFACDLSDLSAKHGVQTKDLINRDNFILAASSKA